MHTTRSRERGAWRAATHFFLSAFAFSRLTFLMGIFCKGNAGVSSVVAVTTLAVRTSLFFKALVQGILHFIAYSPKFCNAPLLMTPFKRLNHLRSDGTGDEWTHKQFPKSLLLTPIQALCLCLASGGCINR